MRTVQSKVDVHKQSSSKAIACKYSLLYSRASGADKCKMYAGWVMAGIAGMITPTTIVLFGDVFDQFDFDDKMNPNYDKLVDMMKWLFLGFTGLGLLICATTFAYNALLNGFAKKTAKDIKQAYLKAILNQDCSWFDSINQAELSSKISSEVAMIEASLGDKMGNLIYQMAMGLGGFGLGFLKGWEISLAVIAGGIVIVPIAAAFGWVLRL